jgi:hypothetical protein
LENRRNGDSEMSNEEEIMIEWELLCDVPEDEKRNLVIEKDWEILVGRDFHPISAHLVGKKLPLTGSCAGDIRRPKSKWVLVKDPDAVIQADWEWTLLGNSTHWSTLGIEDLVGKTINELQLYDSCFQARRPYIELFLAQAVNQKESTPTQSEGDRMMEFFFGVKKGKA